MAVRRPEEWCPLGSLWPLARLSPSVNVTGQVGRAGFVSFMRSATAKARRWPICCARQSARTSALTSFPPSTSGSRLRSLSTEPRGTAGRSVEVDERGVAGHLAQAAGDGGQLPRGERAGHADVVAA